jgi:hypothetical protein|tara:strand:+ start:308 stop:508 length:201 start_codon:yes stop_codon:yes gene_type:complete
MGHWEDLWYEIHDLIEREGLRKEFNAQLKKMNQQDKHKHKDTRERWDYAKMRVITNKEKKTSKNEK